MKGIDLSNIFSVFVLALTGATAAIQLWQSTPLIDCLALRKCPYAVRTDAGKT